MQKILITGNSGYIGSKLLKDLDHEIYGTSSKRPNSLENTYFLDLSCPADFSYNLLNKDWVVIHLAAISSPDLCGKEYERAYEINVTGTKYFIGECLKKGARVIFFSSDAVYGKTRVVFDENSECVPLGKYAEMKYEVEQYFKDDDNFKVFRLSYVFSKDDKLMNYIGQCAKNKEIAKIFDPFCRNVVYIQDLVDVVKNLIKDFDNFTPKIINVCGKKLLSRKDIADLYLKFVDKNLRYELTDPGTEFFKYRARSIETKSQYLENLLGRETTPIEKAMQIEFNK